MGFPQFKFYRTDNNQALSWRNVLATIVGFAKDEPEVC
jgi:hypothetical protein